MPWASALTLATKMSRPPSASAASPTQPAQRRQVGDVDRAAGRLDARARQRRDGLVDRRPGAARADRDVAALRRQQARDGAADSARAAGDDRLLALQSEIHAVAVPCLDAGRAGAQFGGRDCTKDRPRPVRRPVDYAGRVRGQQPPRRHAGHDRRMRLDRLLFAARAAPLGRAAPPRRATPPAPPRAVGQCRFPPAVADRAGRRSRCAGWRCWWSACSSTSTPARPSQVALMTLLRMLPMVLFGAVIGALAERIERRKALIVVGAGRCWRPRSCLALLAYAGSSAVWHLAVASFCNGIAWATDNPVRRVMIGEVVGARADGRGDVDRCRRQQRQPHAGADDRRPAARQRRHRRRVHGQRRLLCGGAGRGDAAAAPQRGRRRSPAARCWRASIEGLLLVAARPAADRHPDRHRHLQRVRLAVHQHDPGDRAGQSAPRRERHRHPRQHGRDRRVLSARSRSRCGRGRRISPGSISAGC